MPEKETLKRARKAKRQGKSPSTQSGEFVREEMHHIREGKHGARSTKQAIAIGLSKARRAGVNLPPPKKGKGFRKNPAQRRARLRERQARRENQPAPLARAGACSQARGPQCRVEKGALPASPFCGGTPYSRRALRRRETSRAHQGT